MFPSFEPVAVMGWVNAFQNRISPLSPFRVSVDLVSASHFCGRMFGGDEPRARVSRFAAEWIASEGLPPSRPYFVVSRPLLAPLL